MTETRNASDVAEGKLDIRAADVLDALVKRNPGASRSQIASTAQLMALVGETVQHSMSHLPESIARSSPLRRAIDLVMLEVGRALAGEGHADPASSDAERDSTPRRIRLAPRKPVEVLQGVGLGERITPAEGRRRLSVYALPIGLEEWAGPLAGPTELAEWLGIARSTLQDWRRSGVVIGLLKGKRKHVFPLEQFDDGQPVRGLADIVAIVGDPRTAWLWLVERNRLGGSRLDALKGGRFESVIEAAREDFA